MCFRPITGQKPIKCPECNAFSPRGSKTCQRCGAELPEEQIACPRCKTMNSASAKACSNCGLTAAEAAQLIETANRPKKCPKCGKINPSTATGCRYCNSNL